MMLPEVRDRGYTGSHSVLRTPMSAQQSARTEEPAGLQMQLARAKLRIGGLRWFAFVVTLGFSRWIFGRWRRKSGS